MVASSAARTWHATPVLLVAGATTLVLLLTAGRHGYDGDELYFIWAGQHPALSYFDQPALVPVLAAALDRLAPGSLFVLRLPSALAVGGAIVVTALIARELGGGRRAQVLAASAVAVSNGFLVAGHLFHTAALDPVLWTVTTWLVVRSLRTRSQGDLLALGLVTAVAVNVKLLVCAFWAVALVCLVLSRQRPALPPPRAVLPGALIAIAGLAPVLYWQIANEWPQADFTSAVAAETSSSAGRFTQPVGYLVGAGLVVGAVMLCHGLTRLYRDEQLRPYRFLGHTTVVLAVAVAVAGGRAYYLLGMFPLCWAASAVCVERAARRWHLLLSPPVRLASGVLAVAMVLPVWPLDQVRANPWLPVPEGELGWPETTRAVAAVADTHPGAVVVAQSCWVASALRHGGIEAHSPNWGCWSLSRPPRETDSLLYLGTVPESMRGAAERVVQVGVVRTGLPGTVHAEGTPIWLLTGATEDWDRLWPALRDLS
ncbi:ArnT family glycosyltransferase [Actinokineospora spheciospongiae]|uniref:ArnT family glycosyltransferase n=1 Tax=Actinokineospora spheciospongiae TaxID=909613 RepID=UPI0015E85390|nr:glycosyltransferase family 39 protein [Actinokineospora spheciospongiae]